MMKTAAVVFTGQEQLEIREEELAPPGPGQVLVRTHKTLISSGTECICYQRNFAPGTHWDQWVRYPFYPGYSAVGEVVGLGAGVETLQLGQRVATRARHAQYSVVDSQRCVVVPDGIPDEEATWFGLASIVQNGVRRAGHALGDDVVVIGLGQLGQLVVQYARLSGARQIIAVDPARSRLELARRSGATATLACSAAAALQAVQELTGGRLADVVYDVTGHPAVFPAALGLARRFGTVLLLGDAGTPHQQHLTGDVVTRGLRVVGAHDSNPPATATDHAYWTHQNMIELFFTYLARGQMNVAALVSQQIDGRAAQTAYRLLLTERSTVMGVILDWSQLR
ncbi:MAG: zinc-binding dehydrogenase [Chloroflexi bacterium]|nr:zinc-binding dehydrogenase [Chloroflexota bacterium]